MSTNVEITGEWQGEIPVLKVRYTPSAMFELGMADTLSENLKAEYRKLRHVKDAAAPKACILEIDSETAGSPIVRGIFELYKVVNADGGALYCANYPANYMESLTSLGLPALPGFQPTRDLEEALQLARAAR